MPNSSFIFGDEPNPITQIDILKNKSIMSNNIMDKAKKYKNANNVQHILQPNPKGYKPMGLKIIYPKFKPQNSPPHPRTWPQVNFAVCRCRQSVHLLNAQ